MPWSALIGAGASLLGGILGKPKRVSAQTNSRQGILGQAQGAREAAEKYGFNPLTLLGVSSPLGPSEGSNYMGNAISEAGLLLADAVSQRQGAGTLSKVQAENQRLRDQVKDLTLRPPVPGVFAQRQAEAASEQPDIEGLRPLPETSAVDPRRDVDHEPARTTSGFMTVDNPYAPWPLYFPTLDGDEALQWYDWPTLAIGIGANAAARGGRWLYDRVNASQLAFPLNINPGTGRFGSNPTPPPNSLPPLPRWR